MLELIIFDPKTTLTITNCGSRYSVFWFWHMVCNLWVSSAALCSSVSWIIDLLLQQQQRQHHIFLFLKNRNVSLLFHVKPHPRPALCAHEPGDYRAVRLRLSGRPRVFWGWDLKVRGRSRARRFACVIFNPGDAQQQPISNSWPQGVAELMPGSWRLIYILNLLICDA